LSSSSSFQVSSKFHESPDGKDDSQNKNDHENDHGIKQLLRQVSEISVLHPKLKHIGPLGTDDTLLVHSVLEVQERKLVFRSNLISNLPHKHNTTEETSQTDGVKSSHVVLGLFPVALEDNQKNHHDGNNSTGGTDDGQPFDHLPDALVLGQESGGLVGGDIVETEGITLLIRFSEDPLSVQQVNWEFLHRLKMALVAGQVGDLWSKVGIIDVECPFVLGVSEFGLVVSAEDALIASFNSSHVEKLELLERRSWVASWVHAFKFLCTTGIGGARTVPFDTHADGFGDGGLRVCR